jgi:two-component sensor histidine kinase
MISGGRNTMLVNFALMKTENYEYERKMKQDQLAMNEINHRITNQI